MTNHPNHDWTDDYPVATYNRAPYPAPGGWVFTEPEGLAYRWVRYTGGVGEGRTSQYDIYDEVDADVREQAFGEDAFLIGEDIGDGFRDETIQWRLTIGNEDGFKRVEPDWPDMLAAVAEALDRYPDGDWQDVAPNSGELPPEVKREREIERRKDENESLGAWGDGDE